MGTGNIGTGNTGNIGNIQQGNIGNNSTCRIYINSTQYFDNVPLAAWESFVGGYQPAQKWLKDRRGRVLSSDDIMHYKAVVSALVETRRLMDELEAMV